MFFRLRLMPLSAALLCLFLTSCSNSDEEKEVGVIEQHNEKMTKKAIEYLKTPIEQAKQAKEALEKHNRMVEESTKPQE